MNKILAVGFTGTIASGKTTRCHRLLQCAVARQTRDAGAAAPPPPPLDMAAARAVAEACMTPQGPPSPDGRVAVRYLNADLVGHSVYEPGTPCHAELRAHFGDGILARDGGGGAAASPIDRRALGRVVFSDPAQLAALNAICWPHISAEMSARTIAFAEAAAAARRPVLLLVIEAALLVEMRATVAACDDVWITHCARAEAVRRVMQRDGLPETEAAQRVASQQDLPAKLAALKAAGFTGGVETFDTTDTTLEEGLRAVDAVFERYWHDKVAPFL